MQGYIAKFLTQLNQQGFTVYLWKLEFKDASDDSCQRCHKEWERQRILAAAVIYSTGLHVLDDWRCLVD